MIHNDRTSLEDLYNRLYTHSDAISNMITFCIL